MFIDVGLRYHFYENFECWLLILNSLLCELAGEIACDCAWLDLFVRFLARLSTLDLFACTILTMSFISILSCEP